MSQDEGLTWSVPTATVLPNNNAGIEAFQLASGSTLLLFNNEKGAASCGADCVRKQFQSCRKLL